MRNLADSPMSIIMMGQNRDSFVTTFNHCPLIHGKFATAVELLTAKGVSFGVGLITAAQQTIFEAILDFSSGTRGKISIDVNGTVYEVQYIAPRTRSRKIYTIEVSWRHVKLFDSFDVTTRILHGFTPIYHGSLSVNAMFDAIKAVTLVSTPQGCHINNNSHQGLLLSRENKPYLSLRSQTLTEMFPV